jgi:predicted nucleotidyltransferase
MPSEDKAVDATRSIYESVIDPTRKMLDPSLFDKTGDVYTLDENARQEFLALSRKFERFGEVQKVYLTGSMLSYQWLPWSDVDLHLVVEFEGDNAYDLAVDCATESGKMLKGTKHRIEIYLENPGQYTDVKYTGLYDVEQNKWVKPPYNMSVELTRYMEKFKSEVVSLDLEKALLMRDLMDYAFLNKLSMVDVGDLSGLVTAKISEINNDVLALVDKYVSLRALRTKALAGEVSPEELQKWGGRQGLPANVIWKLMERYAYQSLLRELKKIVEAGEKEHPQQPISTKLDVQKVSDVMTGKCPPNGRCVNCEG